MDFIRSYDLNDYSLGVSVSVSENPFVGSSNSVIAYPYLTSFTHPSMTRDWLLFQGENVGFRYVAESEWEFGVIGRIQTLGLGDSNDDALLGLDDRDWALEMGPLIGYRGWPVHLQFRSYWELPDRHDGTTSEIDLTLPIDLDRGFFVPRITFTHMSDDYSGYYFGVAPHEATLTRPEYQPGSVINTWIGFNLGYELAPQWLLSTTVGMEFLDSAVSASPIVEHDQLWSVNVGLAYNADLFEPVGYVDEQQQAIEIRVGAFNSQIDTKIIRDASDGQPGDEIDLEDFLGVADRQTVLEFESLFRVGFFHRLEVGYFELWRHSQITLERDVTFGDTTFTAGTDVQTSMGIEVLRAGYSYSLMRDQQKELGVTAGISRSQFETGLSEVGGGQSERQQVNVPLPTLGIFGSVALGTTWRLSADIDFFVLDFDRYDGFMTYANLALERKFGNVFGAGIGYNFYGTRLEAKDDDLRGTFRMRHHGPKLYLSMLF
jgi:outer membrane scaffolding protein for murein synthesis (MipA/OmpV family)